MPETIPNLLAVLDDYGRQFPAESAGLVALREQLLLGDAMNDRRRLPGHITGSAIVLSPDRRQLLLIKHTILQKWLQPGGHWDADEASPLEAARREAGEETGVIISDYLPLRVDSPHMPLDIDIHAIPTNDRKGEPRHYHYDYRYLFLAESLRLDSQDEGVLAAAWAPLADPRTRELGRVVAKLLDYGFVDQLA